MENLKRYSMSSHRPIDVFEDATGAWAKISDIKEAPEIIDNTTKVQTCPDCSDDARVIVWSVKNQFVFCPYCGRRLPAVAGNLKRGKYE